MKGHGITNWYEKLDKVNQDVPRVDKHFKNHYILPNSRIALLGGSGAGKTNILLEFLSRKESFYEIIIFTSNEDEPLLKQLKQDIPEVQIYTDIQDVPELSTFPTNQQEKLIVFDDWINIKKKAELKKIEEYAIASRKKGFTCLFMMQNYTSCPKVIMRQIEYFWVLKLNDNITIQNIIRNHNIHSIPKDVFLEMYTLATQKKGNFFNVDLKTEDPRLRYRINFTGLF